MEELTVVLLSLIAAVLATKLVFLGSVTYRRVARSRYFRRKDQARCRFQPVVERFVGYELTQADAVAELRQAGTGAAEDAVRELLLGRVTAETADRITSLLFALGYVERWARTAFGARAGPILVSALALGRLPFPPRPASRTGDAIRRTRLLHVPRLLAVDALGRLAPDFAEVFALAALDDPAGAVRRVALTSLGRNRRRGTIPRIAEELRAALSAQAEVSARTTKAALVCFGIADLRRFVPLLSDPDPVFRLYVVDSVREICARESAGRALDRRDFPAQLYEEFLERLVHDDSPDVRARSAAVVAQFHDIRASIALRRLLQDDNEFVRLHAVRAAADARYPELHAAVAERMTDRKWRVREAAVRGLARLGGKAQQALLEEFAASVDRYESEQMSEELQRSGLLDRVLSELAGEAPGTALAVSRRMVAVGRTARLKEELIHGRDQRTRLMLLEAFGAHPSADTAELLERLASGSRDAVAERAAALLGAVRGRARSAGAA